MSLGLSLGLGLSKASNAFSPTSIANLSLWLDASDSTTITESGGLVSQWDDKSGNGNNATQGTGSAQPTTGTRTVNGLNSIDFDGTSDFMNFPAALQDVPDAANTVFYVAATDKTIVADQRLFSARATLSTRWGIILQRSNLNEIEYVNSDGAFSPVTASVTIGTTSHIIGQRHNSTTLDCYFDGLATTGASANNTDITENPYMGSNGGTASFFDGTISEILVYEKALTDNEINNVGNYLADKWGITWSDI